MNLKFLRASLCFRGFECAIDRLLNLREDNAPADVREDALGEFNAEADRFDVLAPDLANLLVPEPGVTAQQWVMAALVEIGECRKTLWPCCDPRFDNLGDIEREVRQSQAKLSARRVWLAAQKTVEKQPSGQQNGSEPGKEIGGCDPPRRRGAWARDHEWRLIFGLSRFGGLRCPSEHLALRWQHVDFANNRLIVPQPKVEHHGRATRTIPMFPELRPLLEDAAYAATAVSLDGRLDPEQFVITRYRDSNANLRTQLERIIRKAGIEPWAKPFQNLRSTRETELAEQYPLHVVVAWLGNSQPVAAKHYLQVTAEHFERAIGDGAEIVPKPKQPAEGLAVVAAGEGCVETARNPTRATSAQGRTAAADVPGPRKNPALCGVVREGALLIAAPAPRQGLEPWT